MLATSAAFGTSRGSNTITINSSAMTLAGSSLFNLGALAGIRGTYTSYIAFMNNAGDTIQSSLSSTGLLVGGSATITGTLGVTGDITSQASDKRLKENIITITSALDKVNKLNGVYFNFTDEANKLNKNLSKNRQVGFLAQEIQSVLPEIVKPAPFDIDSDGNSISGENYLTIHYEKVVPLLLQAIKELKLELDEIKKLIK